MVPVSSLLAAALPAYLAGAVPFGLILGKALRGIDIRARGSHNLGATNALRVLGAPIGLTVLALDLAKGLLPTLLAPRIAGAWAAPAALDERALAWASLAAALAAVLGHVCPVYLGFRGGKGVATGAGALIALAPLPAATAVLAFSLTVAATRWVSLGSIVAALVLPAALAALERDALTGRALPLLAASLAISALVLARHRGNIGRILDGNEPRLGERPRDLETPERTNPHAAREPSPAPAAEAREDHSPRAQNTVGP
jgi:glycerol-3-phosphate acyltransferase PlsY